MRFKLLLPAVLLLGLLAIGCAPMPLEVNPFEPVIDDPRMFAFPKDKDTYVAYRDEQTEIAAGLFEYNHILALLIAITNKSTTDETPKEYAISLADGRDLKPIKMLERDDLVKIKAKFSGSGGGALQDQVIEATMNNVMNVVNVPTKDKLLKIISQGIDEYFSFRPIYAGEKREGVLCFLPDFKLEYPLTLMVKLRSETVKFRFAPKKPT